MYARRALMLIIVIRPVSTLHQALSHYLESLGKNESFCRTDNANS